MYHVMCFVRSDLMQHICYTW